MEEIFIEAIKNRQLILVDFYSKDDGKIITRLCAPMDYGPSRRTYDNRDRFHLWDYDSDQGSHTLSLLPYQIQQITVLDHRFDPAEFITWETNWIIPRDWGEYS